MSGDDRSRPSSANGLILEAWSQGLMVGSLLIMAAVAVANMRKRILLHKLIVTEVCYLLIRHPVGHSSYF